MSNDSSFGRRNTSARASVSPGQARQGRAESVKQLEPAAGSVPVPAETSERETLLYVTAGVALLFGTVAIGLVGLPMLSKLTPQMGAVHLSPPTPARPPARVAAPSEQAFERPAEEVNQEPVAEQKSATDAGSSPQHQAAMKFLGFYHLNTRARAAYCGKLGVDMSAFNAQFRDTQIANHRRAVAIVAKSGLTEDHVYEQSRAELETAIQGEQQQISQKMGLPPMMGCSVMAQHADKVIPGIDFAKIMPNEHRVLSGS